MPVPQQQRLEDSSIGQGLLSFVRSALGRSVDDIKSWDIIQKTDNGHAQFSIRFGDGSHGYTGWIMQRDANSWVVYSFHAFVTVTNTQPMMTWEPIEPTPFELEWVEQQRKLQDEMLTAFQLISPEHLEENHNAH